MLRQFGWHSRVGRSQMLQWMVLFWNAMRKIGNNINNNNYDNHNFGANTSTTRESRA